jgi:hypothetical protein
MSMNKEAAQQCVEAANAALGARDFAKVIARSHSQPSFDGHSLGFLMESRTT